MYAVTTSLLRSIRCRSLCKHLHRAFDISAQCILLILFLFYFVFAASILSTFIYNFAQYL